VVLEAAVGGGGPAVVVGGRGVVWRDTTNQPTNQPP